MYLCPIKFEVGESKHKYSSPHFWVLIFSYACIQSAGFIRSSGHQVPFVYS